MGEKGWVLNTKNDGRTAVVAFNRTEACAKCKACMSGFIESQMVLEAKNNAGAKEGDLVIVELPENGFFTASVIMYIFPLITMVAGFFGGGILARSLGISGDVLSFALGIFLLSVSLLIIRLNEKKLKSMKIFLPYVARIADDSERNND